MKMKFYVFIMLIAFGFLSMVSTASALFIDNGIVGDGSWEVDVLDGGESRTPFYSEPGRFYAALGTAAGRKCIFAPVRSLRPGHPGLYQPRVSLSVRVLLQRSGDETDLASA